MSLPHGAVLSQTRKQASDPISMAVAQRDSSILENVRAALDREEAFLLFQPVVDAGQTGRVAFYEGLIRILDDTGRVIPAKDFIFAVEDRAEGRMIDCLALKLGLQALNTHPDLRISINMSARSIGFPQWIETFKQGIHRDPTLAERLIVEITESSAMAAPEITCAFMESLQNSGVAFALDDFGAGFTSFRYLRDFFFDIVKLDRSFITGIDRNPDNQACVAALQTLAAHFEMFSVAEGIETPAEAATLTRFGIDCFQGYLYGAPATLPTGAKQRKRA